MVVTTVHVLESGGDDYEINPLLKSDVQIALSLIDTFTWDSNDYENPNLVFSTDRNDSCTIFKYDNDSYYVYFFLPERDSSDDGAIEIEFSPVNYKEMTQYLRYFFTDNYDTLVYKIKNRNFSFPPLIHKSLKGQQDSPPEELIFDIDPEGYYKQLFILILASLGAIPTVLYLLKTSYFAFLSIPVSIMYVVLTIIIIRKIQRVNTGGVRVCKNGIQKGKNSEITPWDEISGIKEIRNKEMLDLYDRDKRTLMSITTSLIGFDALRKIIIESTPIHSIESPLTFACKKNGSIVITSDLIKVREKEIPYSGIKMVEYSTSNIDSTVSSNQWRFDSSVVIHVRNSIYSENGRIAIDTGSDNIDLFRTMKAKVSTVAYPQYSNLNSDDIIQE